ncbi:hypothetical protein RB195_002770 [Necator americanus]|uniref:Uncharacterized protein n=1 Tax=Necator americanus TaxID=51031 RepID=A0ABR1DLF6_NECAM
MWAVLVLLWTYPSSILSILTRYCHLVWPLLRLRPLGQRPINIINCYSPTSAADESELDAFYEVLEEVVCNEESFYKEDLNAKLGRATEEEYKIRRSGLRDRNENVNRLAALLSAAPLFHGNFLFVKKNHRR